jgi:hypothetical protein
MNWNQPSTSRDEIRPDIANIQKVFIYGMPSSGSSLLAFLCAQKENSIAILDCHCQPPAITLNEKVSQCIIKTTIKTTSSLERDKEKYKPDFTIYVQRNFKENIQSLRRKKWRNWSGSIQQKIKIRKKISSNLDIFDAVINYEDLLNNQSKVIELLRPIGFQDSYFYMNRSLKEIVKFTKKNCLWARNNFNWGWSVGDLKPGRKLKS